MSNLIAKVLMSCKTYNCKSACSSFVGLSFVTRTLALDPSWVEGKNSLTLYSSFSKTLHPDHSLLPNIPLVFWGFICSLACLFFHLPFFTGSYSVVNIYSFFFGPRGGAWAWSVFTIKLHPLPQFWESPLNFLWLGKNHKYKTIHLCLCS